MNDTTAQTHLFRSPHQSASADGQVSARAAYQFALYDRAALVDARRDRTTGAIHPDLAPRLIDDVDRVTFPRVFVLADTDDDTARAVTQLRAGGRAVVAGVRGGFRAWVEAGLPVAVA